MAFGKLVNSVEKFVERRTHERSGVAAQGRLMLADHREFPCTITDMSVGGASVLAPESGAVGEPVVVYVDDCGRLRGKIVRVFEGGFAMRLDGPSRAADELLKRFDYA
jgi:hypothetical protein